MIEHFYEKIEGWATYGEQGKLLERCLQEIDSSKEIKIAEIGVYKGRGTALWNTILLNRNIKYDYYAIDHFEGSEEHKTSGIVPTHEEAIQNLHHFAENLSIIKLDSISASKLFKTKSLDIIYIDGSHDYKSVLKDIKAWFSRLKPNGIICGDDFNEHWQGVVDAVTEFAQSKNLTIEKVGSSQWMTKK
jgi:predicted O-methyltransferase YrrM